MSRGRLLANQKGEEFAWIKYEKNQLPYGIL